MYYYYSFLNKIIDFRELKVRLYFTWQAAGSHEIWFNGTTKYFTTIPNHPGDIPEGTLRAILKQANVSIEEFLSN